MSAVKELSNDVTQVGDDVPTHAIVRLPDGEGTSREVADLASVSATGAGFYIKKECNVGTIVSMMLPLEPHLRCYDHEKEFYKVWGLVQHCQPLSSEDNVGYHVGVAFIGKHPPNSYEDNVEQAYKICGMTEDGLWRVTEARAQFKVRKHVRYWTTIDLYLVRVDAQKNALNGEKTTTENVSKNGAAVFSELSVTVGDRVKFICEKLDFSGLAVVCDRREGKEGKAILHLQFVENHFPVEKLDRKSISKPKKK